MRCVICKEGKLTAGLVTVTLQRNETTVIVKGVPADVCNNCGEYYLTSEVTDRLFARANDAVACRAEVEILRYAA